jgi:hypothetical protein
MRRKKGGEGQDERMKKSKRERRRDSINKRKRGT